MCDPRADEPVPSITLVLQASLTIAYILFGGGFRSLINLFSVASALSPPFWRPSRDRTDLASVLEDWLFYFLTGTSAAISPRSTLA